MNKELSKGFTGIEINGVRFSNIKEMLIYMNKQRDHIINLEEENSELKLKLEALEGQTPWKDIKDKSELIGKLTKAIELLKWALHSDPEHDEDFEKKWSEAEQFLSEV